MILAVVKYYLGYSAKLPSFILIILILIGYEATNRPKSTDFLCHTSVNTQNHYEKDLIILLNFFIRFAIPKKAPKI